MANGPSGNLNQQAQFYAGAAVPTLASINQQFGMQQGNVSGYTAALVKLLQAGAGADPYGGAVASQSAANQAAMARLGALGSPYAANSAAAVGGMGDSALGALNANRGAARAYQAAMPGVAAARGQLAQSSLLTQKNAAITQRSQQYQSAYAQALQQLRAFSLQQNAQRIQQSQFAQNLANQQREFAATQAYNYAALAAAHPTSTTGTGSGAFPGFNSPNASGWGAAVSGLTRNELATGIKGAMAILNPSGTSKTIPVYGYRTADGQTFQTYLAAHQHDGTGKISTFTAGYRNITIPSANGNPVAAGHTFNDTLLALQGQGVDPVVAMLAAGRYYSQYRGNYKTPQITAAYRSFATWMAANGFRGYAQILKGMQSPGGVNSGRLGRGGPGSR